MTSRKWSYTLNNYTEQEVTQLKALKTKMHMCSKEICPTTGTPHLQGCLVLENSARLAAMKTINPRAHWTKTIVDDASANYCTKGEIIINYDERKPGKRNDLEDVKETLMTKGLKQVAKEHFGTYIKYSRGIEKAQFLLEETKDWYPTEVLVFWGKSGTGKSKTARKIDKNLYNVPEPSSNGCVWWDGYNGQETILFDDFYGWIKHHTFLQYTDGYPMILQSKGGHINRQWTRVIITSNKHPKDWYPNVDSEGYVALSRRFTKIVNLDADTEVSDTEVV